MTRRLGILGSTGSIGTQTLDVVRNFPSEFDVVAVSTHTSPDRLKEQTEEFDPEVTLVSDPNTDADSKWVDDDQTLRSIAQLDLDILVVAVVGMAGLLPTLDALKEGTMVALASKEAMVVGGELIREVERTHNGRLLPLDSEHHAVFQLLRGETQETVDTVYLTASGGPFYGRSRESLESITVDEALDHPNWDMGPKITVDSATMMNKGLELIEAKFFFDLDPDQVRAIVHPQSLVHALVEFNDRSIKTHLSQPDMRHTIQSALLHPERREGIIDSMDFSRALSLEFKPVNPERFPAYALARRALSEGGSAPTVLNAANAEAVRAFLNEEISFLDIPSVIEHCMDRQSFDREVTVDRVLAVDKETRNRARSYLETVR